MPVSLWKSALAAAIVCAAALSACSPGPDVEAGHRLATAKCARCHAVGATGASPLAAAPPFRTFSAKWPVENLEEALAEGIMVGHPVMPDFAPLSRREVDSFIAYLRTIQNH